MKKRYIIITALCILFFICTIFSKRGMEVVRILLRPKTDRITVAIDAGHGGFDPGKIGINNTLEKDINLSIAIKLKDLLEQNDIRVIMTREDDECLCNKSDRNKKQTDMKNRVDIINSSGAEFAISIHQNSFTQESSRGAQVFYYEKSEEGKEIAETLQERIKLTLNDGNHRLARANSNYYLLRNTNCPLVIVECGFLTNREEVKLLNDEDYQDKVAWAIHLGVLEYIQKKYGYEIEITMP
jgi:N-acetylmuramoyl-L-alanine amidase